MWYAQPPKVVKQLYPSLHWRIPTNKKEIFITFDDGPTAGVTEQVLDLLNEYQAKATFFCLGKNVEKEPKLFERILNENHTVGNHTYNHLNGWTTQSDDYLQDIYACSEVFESKLFRPPYGKIKSKQLKKLSKTFQIIMWSSLSLDYDSNYQAKECLNFATKNLKAGSIIVFHDSLKAQNNMLFALAGTLKYAREKGYQCKAIKAPF
jgi:peptidoglycan/xylan/chitin deacetylase (PgdA/CDA1 family)